MLDRLITSASLVKQLETIVIIFFQTSFCIIKLSIQIQISLMIGDLHSAGLITGISSENKINE